MSDRREAVARAIGNALITRSDIAAVADAAIAAYEATEPTDGWAAIESGSIERAEWESRHRKKDEPTEAEVEAARHEYITKLDAFIEAAKANADCQCYSRDDYPECVETIYENAGHEAMRAALIAARKARKEAGK